MDHDVPPPPSISAPSTSTRSHRERLAEAIHSFLYSLDEEPDAILHPKCICYEQDLLWMDLTADSPATEEHLDVLMATAYEGCRTYQEAEDNGRIYDVAFHYVEQIIEGYPTPGERHAALYSVILHLVQRLARYQLPTEASR